VRPGAEVVPADGWRDVLGVPGLALAVRG
jgi:hypothetical protein